MNKKKICFFLFIVIELLLALGLEFLTVIVAAYLAIRKKQLNPILRMALVMSGVNMVLLDYYFFFDTNLIYLLAVLAIAYMFTWPATED